MLSVKPGTYRPDWCWAELCETHAGAFDVVGRNDARAVDRIGVQIRAADDPSPIGKSYSPCSAIALFQVA